MFSLSIFLYIYLAFLFVWAVFSFTGVYHLLKFGFKNSVTILSMVAYLGVSSAILGVSAFYILQIDWSERVMETNQIEAEGQFWSTN